MRALLFDCRAFGARRIHSSSRSSVFCRAEAAFSSLFSRSRFLLEPRTVVPLPRNSPAAVEFQNPAGDVVQEIAIVRHGHDRARIFRQMPLEPVDRLGVQMVRRFVETVADRGGSSRILQRATRRRLAAGEIGDAGIAGGQIHRIHRDFHLPTRVPKPPAIRSCLARGLARRAASSISLSSSGSPRRALISSEPPQKWPEWGRRLPRHFRARFCRDSIAAPATDSRR